MWRARVDIPEFTRCCFCIPLRYGILSWAYLKAGALGITALAHTLEAIYIHSSFSKAFDILTCTVLYSDIISTIFCIVVGHMKHRRGLTIYFYCSLSILIAYVTISVAYTIASLIKYSRYIHHQWIVALQEIFITLLGLFVQVYVLLLVRSEILKLSAPPNLQFVNNDAEAVKRDAILEEREDTESRTGDDAYAYTY